MNTADRSIALVDAAMRRRFAFVPLHPARAAHQRGARVVADSGGPTPTRAADLLDELNAAIDDPDFQIGPSYFMRAAVYGTAGWTGSGARRSCRCSRSTTTASWTAMRWRSATAWPPCGRGSTALGRASDGGVRRLARLEPAATRKRRRCGT